MSRKLLQLQDKGWFIGLMQGSVKYFKVFLQGIISLIQERSYSIF